MFRCFQTLLLLAAILCLGFAHVMAWQARGNYHNAAHPGKCAITETLIISPGEKVKSPDNCAEIKCHNEDGDATINGCGAVAAPDGCEWGNYVNELAPFPECCARYLNCVGGLNNETQSFQLHIWEMLSPYLIQAGIQGAADVEK